MKLLSVFMSVLLIFSLCFTANAAETDSPVMHPLGDANYDGAITSDDARLILRISIGLENILVRSFVYCDCDFDGVVRASDARFALRTAVGLEEKQSYAFEVTDVRYAKCFEEGMIKGKCAVTGKEVSVSYDKLPHTAPQEICCTGTAACIVCGAEMTAKITHEYIVDFENDTKECALCGHKEPLNHVHSFDSNHMCACNKDATAILQEDITEYLKKNGIKGDGYYYISEYIEPLTFALFYEDRLGFSYAYCGFSAVAEDTVIYYDFNYDFEDGTIEAVLYSEDTQIAYAYGDIYPLWVDAEAAGDAITLIEYNVSPEFYGMEREFRRMMEGAVNDCVLWLKACADTLDIDYAEHIFADYVNVK